MAPAILVKYLYASSDWPEDELNLVLAEFEAAGYDLGHRCMARSVLEAAGQLPSGSVLVVYTMGLFSSIDEFLELLVRLQERGVLLQSLKEPWVNEPIRDHAYCVEKFRKEMSVLQNKAEHFYEIK